MSNKLRRSLLSIAFTLIVTAPVMATDGYFSSGFGVKEQGQGGAGVALPQDSWPQPPIQRVWSLSEIDLTSASPCSAPSVVGRLPVTNYPRAIPT